MNRKIYFLCPDNATATGGVKQLYRQVDILNKNGFNACILHKKKGFRSNWFINNTKIEYNRPLFKEIIYLIKFYDKNNIKSKFNYYKIKSIKFFGSIFNSNKIDKDGILVFPEIYGPNLSLIEKDIKKVIFNQNCYYTFDYYNIQNEIVENPYTNKNTIATIVASEDAKKYLSFAFPNIDLYRLHLGIDSSKFYYSDKKKKQIAFMPRKLGEDVNQVISILKIRNNLNNWKFVPIEDKNEDQVAGILRESSIFLSFNYKEGFGLPPAEAMACGCIVVGYQGRGGIEYFNPDFSFPVMDRDIISFAEKIESLIYEFDNKTELMISKGKLASNFVLNKYSFENEEADIIKIWNEILLNN